MDPLWIMLCTRTAPTAKLAELRKGATCSCLGFGDSYIEYPTYIEGLTYILNQN